MDGVFSKLQNVIIEGNLIELQQLLYSQPTSGSNQECVNSTEQLSHAYAELRHRNIPLSADIVNFIEYELVKASYKNIAYQITESNATAKNYEQANRVTHMVKCINLIVKHHHTGLYSDIDELLILRLRQIYAHVFFLKTHYRKLPLLKVQFCIAVFLKLVTGKPVNGFDIYVFAIDKERLIRFLTLIKDELVNPTSAVISLEEYRQCVLQSIKSTQRRSLVRVPKRVRTFIWMDIQNDSTTLFDSTELENSFENLSPRLQTFLKTHYEKTIQWDLRRRSKRIFKELNDTYYIMKQHYSILKILTYIDGMQDSNVPNSPIIPRPVPTTTRIRAIKRTLQVIGEAIKSTRETPNITVKLNRVLQLITSDVLTERTKDLRQFYSHGYPLSKWELERDDRAQPDKLAQVFQKIETNLLEARRWFVYTQAQQNLRIYRQYLAYLRSFKSIDELRDYIAFVGTEFKATLIQSFLPDQLTEAQLLIEYLLRDFTHSPLESSESIQGELQFILHELQLRIVTIRSENKTLGRSVDEFFFLETYISQSTAQLDRVRQIVDWILARTEHSNRHKLVQKTDLMYARELIARIQMAEKDDMRRYLWGNVWERLAKESFTGIDTLRERTEPPVNVALDETVRTLQALGLPLELEEYVQFTNRRLAKSYYTNMFVLDNKYRVLKEIIKDRRVQTHARRALEKLKEARKMDEIMLQRMFDELLDSMEQLLHESGGISSGSSTSTVNQLALEYCLLEVAEILCNLALFRDNMADLAMAFAPVVTGRNLRNYLAHDSLAYDTLTNSTRTVVLNAKYLVESRYKLYNAAMHTPFPSTPCGAEAKCGFQDIFKQQTDWILEQVDFFKLVQHFHTHALSQLVERVERKNAGANLLLMRRNFLEQDIISIALGEKPALFIKQLLGYEESSGNFFHLLINYLKHNHLAEKVKLLIQNPYTFCFRVAINYGLIDVIRTVHRHCDENIMQQIIGKEMCTIFSKFPADVISELMRKFPLTWFHEADDRFGNTILHWVVLRGHRELLVSALHSNRTYLNARNKFGDVPLMLAVRYHSNVVAELLLDFGADPFVDVKILQTIAMRDNQQLLKRIHRQWRTPNPLSSSESRFNNPLRAAIEGNHLETFKLLYRSFRYSLQHGEVIHLAARLNRIDFLRYILRTEKDEHEHGNLIDSVNEDYSFTPLMLACATGHFECAQILLQHGANGLFQNKNACSPWHCAVHSGQKNILSLLLSIAELNVNLLTRDKRSALTIAIENGQNTTQIMFLLRAGVLIRAEDVIRACLLEKLDILKLFIDHNPELLWANDFLQRNPLMIAVVLRNETMVQYLLEQGVNLVAVNTLGMNCLHVAALNNSTHICKRLLEAKVNYDIEDNAGRTPLVVALENEHLRTVELLLQYGANVESVYKFRYPNHRNATLLHKFTIEKRPQIVEYLISKLKFPTDMKDDDGKTAKMYEHEV